MPSHPLLFLLAAALLVPWATRQPFYCHHLCPHGAAQELIGRVRPRRFLVTLRADVVRGLEYYTGPVYEVELLLETKDEKGRPVRGMTGWKRGACATTSRSVATSCSWAV